MASYSQKIVHVISSLHRGGAETLLLHLVRELKMRGWQQHVVYIYPGPLRDELRALDIPLHHLYVAGSYSNPLMWWRLCKYVYKVRPDVIHTSLWAANFMGRIVGWLLRIPVVASLHALAEHEGKVRNYIDRVIPVRARRTIAASQGIATSVVGARMYKKNDLCVIPNGIDVVDLKNRAAAAQGVPYVVDQYGCVVGTVGRLVPVKKFDVLILAFSQVVLHYPQARLLIIGTGPEEAALRRLIQEQLCFEAITLITHQNAAPYYRSFNCFVQPSQYEGLSLALLEALAMKLPVIVTGKEHQHEVITHGVDGFVVEPNNTESLCQALRILLQDAQLANNMGTAGYEKVMKDHAFPRVADSYERVFSVHCL